MCQLVKPDVPVLHMNIGVCQVSDKQIRTKCAQNQTAHQKPNNCHE
jgi:hypothetical protein